jgi:hypothetical protein
MTSQVILIPYGTLKGCSPDISNPFNSNCCAENFFADRTNLRSAKIVFFVVDVSYVGRAVKKNMAWFQEVSTMVLRVLQTSKHCSGSVTYFFFGTRSIRGAKKSSFFYKFSLLLSIATFTWVLKDKSSVDVEGTIFLLLSGRIRSRTNCNGSGS